MSKNTEHVFFFFSIFRQFNVNSYILPEKEERELVLEPHKQFHKAESKWCPHSFILGPSRKLQDYITSTLINIPNCCIQINSLSVHVNLKMLENQLKSNVLEVALTSRNLMLQYETPSSHSYPHMRKYVSQEERKIVLK